MSWLSNLLNRQPTTTSPEKLTQDRKDSALGFVIRMTFSGLRDSIRAHFHDIKVKNAQLIHIRHQPGGKADSGLLQLDQSLANLGQSTCKLFNFNAREASILLGKKGEALIAPKVETALVLLLQKAKVVDSPKVMLELRKFVAQQCGKTTNVSERKEILAFANAWKMISAKDKNAFEPELVELLSIISERLCSFEQVEKTGISDQKLATINVPWRTRPDIDTYSKPGLWPLTVLTTAQVAQLKSKLFADAPQADSCISAARTYAGKVALGQNYDGELEPLLEFAKALKNATPQTVNELFPVYPQHVLKLMEIFG